MRPPLDPVSTLSGFGDRVHLGSCGRDKQPRQKEAQLTIVGILIVIILILLAIYLFRRVA